MRELQRDFGCSVLFVSHHLGVIAELCDEVIVMYAGEVCESGPTREVFHNPHVDAEEVNTIYVART